MLSEPCSDFSEASPFAVPCDLPDHGVDLQGPDVPLMRAQTAQKAACGFVIVAGAALAYAAYREWKAPRKQLP